MAISKPYQINVSGAIWDSSTAFTLTWQVAGSVQTAFTVTITTNSSTPTTVWTSNQTTYSLQCSIPANTLTNGTAYKLTVNVTGQDGSTAQSDPVTFSCSSVPTVTLPTIGTVGNQSVSLTATYSQKENVSLSNWTAILYDNNYNILQQSSLQTTTTQPTTQTSPLSFYLTYQFTGLNTGKTYYVEFQSTSSLGLTGTTGKVSFTTQFSQPTLHASVEASNTSDCGINLQWYVNQIIGQSTTTPTYIANDEVDLTTGNSVWFNQGFNINNNFTLKLWLSSVQNYHFSTTPVIVAGSTAPQNNINALWLYDSDQATQVNILPSVSSTTPVSNRLWIVDSNATTERPLTSVVIDTTQPTGTNVFWVDAINPVQNIALVTMNGDNGKITLEYSNGTFHLFTIDSNGNKTEQAVYSVAGNSYYLYIQQIGSSYNLSAQALS